MRYGNFYEDIELLGSHSDVLVKKQDVLAISGVKIAEWKGQRILQTTYLTVIEVNPGKRQGIPTIADEDDSTPKTKALKMATRDRRMLSDVKEMLQTLEQQKSESIEQNKKMENDKPEVCIHALMSNFTVDFFEYDPPLVP